jgi:acyl-CoA synthetase (AMP-forming)/AMP-acid ligase II
VRGSLLLDRLSTHAGERPDEPALVDVESGETWSWRRLAEASRNVTEKLLDGSRFPTAVLLRKENGVEFVAEFLGILGAGCDALCVSPDLSPAEVKRLEYTCDSTVASADGVLLPSSGTTGLPKIVRRVAKTLDAMAEVICHTIGVGPADRVFAAAPFCHSYGMEHGLLAPIWAGACMWICRRFDAVRAAKMLENEITIFPGVPFMFESLAHLPVAGDSESGLRRAYSAGGPLPISAAEAFAQRFGVGVGQVYGATEVGSVTFSDPDSDTFAVGSVGQPMPGVSILIDENSQIVVKSPWMLDGYVGQGMGPNHLNGDGHFLTGDIGKFDNNGNLLITGRLKLMVDVGGKKVNPLEVESVLANHPKVEQCVVLPMATQGTNTRLRALVTARRPAAPPTAEELRRFVKDRLAAYKVPRVFEVRDRLPMSPAGKVLRHLVQE